MTNQLWRETSRRMRPRVAVSGAHSCSTSDLQMARNQRWGEEREGVGVGDKEEGEHASGALVCHK